MKLRLFSFVLLVAVFAAMPFAAKAANLQVTRATLSNGLRVIVVNDPLAPVVTTMLNYKVGSDDQTIDGLAHATEHMMFRGSKTLSSSALTDSIDITGGDFDADTQSEITQYFFTVPSEYLDIALRLERSRATGLLMSQNLWNQERGAITQEVTRDNSDAGYRLYTKISRLLTAGTPYAKNGLGTIYGFAHQVQSPQLLNFYHTWYHPNNAVYVIVGDVDGPATVAKVKALFGDIPAAPLPARASGRPAPLHATIFHDTSDQPYTAAFLGYRLPGYNSPDYAAGQIVSDVLNSQRGDLYVLTASGKAYQTEFDVESYPGLSIGVAFAAVPITTKPEEAASWIKTVIENYRKNGVSNDLVQAQKLREIAQLQFSANSISDLASEWSTAVAVQGLRSPDDLVGMFQKVTKADVDRVLRTYLVNSTAIAGYAVPKNSGALANGGGVQTKENNSIPPSTHEPLPSWAQSVLAHLKVPPQTLAPVSMTLSNGIRLIVQPETITQTVVVTGRILNNPQVQEPPGKEGVADIASTLLPYGTTTYDRIAFQTQLDSIAATTSVGTDFGLSVLANRFDRGVQLLADDELHPAFNGNDFRIVQRQSEQSVADDQNSPDHLTEVALANALYPAGDPMRRFPTPQSIGSVTLPDVQSWYDSAYRPDLTTIVVIGNVTPQQVRATFEKYFGAWTANGPKPNIYPLPVAQNVPSQVNVPATGREQASAQLVETIGLLRSDPDWANLELGNVVLTGGFYSSLLFHDLREVHGYVYDVNSSVGAGKVRSTFDVEFGSDPKNVLPAENEIVANLRLVQQKPVAADRLLRSKALLLGSIPIREASYDGVSALLLNYATQDLPLDQNLIDAQRELNATQTSVQTSFAKWIRPDGFVRIITGPAPGS